jgi:hypothetical protein
VQFSTHHKTKSAKKKIFAERLIEKRYKKEYLIYEN